MGGKGRKEFLETVSGDEEVVRYVKLFRMPLFLTVLDDELKKCDGAVWEEESAVKEIAGKVMPDTLLQFGFPQEEIDSLIGRCVAAYMEK